MQNEDIQTNNKKLIYRIKALNHYYNNLDYYRNYYLLNKNKLMDYSREYKRKKKKSIDSIISSTLENKSSLKRPLMIQRGQFVIDWD